MNATRGIGINSRSYMLQTVFLGTVAILASLAVGAAVAYGRSSYLLALVGVAAAVAVALWNRGVFAAGGVLLLLNGVPYFNVQLGPSAYAAGASILSDVIYIALAGFLVLCTARRVRTAEHERVALLVLGWAMIYLMWWFIKVVYGSPGMGIFAAAKDGRSFFYYGTLLPLLVYGLRQRRDLLGFFFTLAAGVTVFSIGQIAATEHHALHGLIHIDYVSEFGGASRIYASMNDLLIAAFPLAFATTLLGPKAWRRWAFCVAVLTAVANALSFTRAAYFSEILALVLISAIWVWDAGPQARRVRGFVFIALLATLTIVISGASSEGSGGSSSPVQAVVARVALGISNLQNQTGTAAVRLRATNIEFEELGSHWVAGLGFQEAEHRYVPGLPHGALQDTDLGSLTELITMGIVGLVLAYLPALGGLVYLLRRRWGFMQYGGAMYLGTAILSSVTLGAFSTVSGIVVLSSVLALVLNWTARDEASSTFET